MSEITVRQLDLEIEDICGALSSLSSNLRNNFDDYIFKKSLVNDKESTNKCNADFVNSLNTSKQNVIIQTQKYTRNLNSNLTNLLSNLESTVENYTFVKKILALDGYLKYVKEHMHEDSYSASEHLVKAKSLLDECFKSGRSSELYRQLNEEYYNLLTAVSMATIEKWNEFVSFKMTEQNKSKCACFIVSTSNHESLETVFRTLELLKVTYKETFRDHLIKEFIKPLILFNCSLKVDSDNNVNMFSLDYTTSKQVKPKFNDVIEGLIKLFSFINSTLDLRFETNGGFISSIGSITSSEFLKLFVDEHLAKKIPLKRTQLDEYKQVAEEANRVAVVLYSKGFISEGDDCLIKDYCSNIEEVFESKVGSRYKDVAVSLIHQDLHDMMPIEDKNLSHSLPDLHQIHLPFDNNADWSGFFNLLNTDERKTFFPRCRVSKSIFELTNIIQGCIEEASVNNSTLSKNLQEIACEILHEYLKLPDIHRKLLDIIPQQSALVFTNTLYLTMQLMQLENDFNVKHLFDDLINQLQTMAFREFNKQIMAHEEIMVSALQKSGLQELRELEVFPKSVDKAVRQCLRQAILLQTVWMNVLPQDIYCLTMGRIVNRFIEAIIDYIISTRDISEEFANNLVEVFTLIKDKAPQVFPESREVHRYVKSWMKLQELGLVLAGSLADINERWAGGSGPLAHELEASQVRSLILALFQPSDVRQRTLSTIK